MTAAVTKPQRSGAAAPPRPADALGAERDLILQRGREILARESEAVLAAQSRLGDAFVRAVRLVRDCTGRIAVSGVGKAGDIGKKIQDTLASTATPAYLLHPV